MKVNWNQLKVNWNQLKVNSNQLKSIESKLKSIESKLKSFLKLIDQKNVEGGAKKVRVIEYPQIV